MAQKMPQITYNLNCKSEFFVQLSIHLSMYSPNVCLTDYCFHFIIPLILLIFLLTDFIFTLKNLLQILNCISLSSCTHAVTI